MFARRNTITLAAIWLILLIAGVFLYIKDTRKLVDVMKTQVELGQELQSSRKEVKKLIDVEKRHGELSSQWLNSKKKIISADEPAFSLSYVNWIMSKNNLLIDFDFKLNKTSQSEKHIDFVYTVTGEGRYSDILKFVWFLTYEPILYQINAINLSRTSDSNEFLKFSITLQGYSVQSELELDGYAELTPTNVAPSVRKADVFNPLVKPKPKKVVRKVEKPKLPPRLPGQVDVEKATLKVVTSNSIFISDDVNKMVELQVGAAVYLGSLIAINQTTNEATFVISKFGQSQTVILGLDYRK